MWSEFRVNTLAAAHGLPQRLRLRLLRAAGVRVGAGTTVSGGCYFGSPDIALGDAVYVGPGCLFDGAAPVRVGDGVFLAFNVTLATSSHRYGPPAGRAGAAANAPVVVGAGTWVGAGATVLPGVTVAPGCVVAAGAVVVRDTEPDGLYAGVPARRVKDL